MVYYSLPRAAHLVSCHVTDRGYRDWQSGVAIDHVVLEPVKDQLVAAGVIIQSETRTIVLVYKSIPDITGDV